MALYSSRRLAFFDRAYLGRTMNRISATAAGSSDACSSSVVATWIRALPSDRLSTAVNVPVSLTDEPTRTGETKPDPVKFRSFTDMDRSVTSSTWRKQPGDDRRRRYPWSDRGTERARICSFGVDMDHAGHRCHRPNFTDVVTSDEKSTRCPRRIHLRASTVRRRV